MIRFLLFLWLAASLHAANLCVGPAATGSGNGTDWNNIMVPPSGGGVRGNVYYFQDGTGSAYTANFVFSTANSGTTTITWKKATVADHGPSTGWSDAYGDGQAVFNPSTTITWDVRTSYWIFDGQLGAMNNNGTVATTFGFRVNAPDDTGTFAGIHFVNGNTPDHVTFKYIEGVGAGYGSGTNASRWFMMGVAGGSTDITFQHCYVRDCGQMWLYAAFQTTNLLVEYCYFQNVGSGAALLFHSAGIFLNNFDNASSGFIFRYNTLEGMVALGATGYIIISTVPGGAGGFDLYGCIIKDPNNLGASVPIGNASSDVISSINIYNFTFYGLNGSNCDIKFNGGATGNVKNNLWQACATTPTITSGSGTLTTATNILNTASAASFVSAGTGNFRLTAHTSTGTTLSSPYDTDPDGSSRSGFGNWDIGAFECTGANSGGTTLSGKVTISGNATIR